MSAHWYVIHVYSGFEKKVAQSIREQAEQKGLGDKFEEVLVPTEEVVEVRRGAKVSAERKFFPGYVLVKMEMTDQAFHLIKNTPKVTGFLGSGAKPQPISEREAARYFGGVEAAKAEPKREIHVDYEIGDQVKVNAGPFASFNGVVEELDYEKQRVKVSVSIFGRATPVELGFEEVELVK
jgi:transcriptional antiterminator NusG